MGVQWSRWRNESNAQRPTGRSERVNVKADKSPCLSALPQGVEVNKDVAFIASTCTGEQWTIQARTWLNGIAGSGSV
jgi:hypothetical protein